MPFRATRFSPLVKDKISSLRKLLAPTPDAGGAEGEGQKEGKRSEFDTRNRAMLNPPAKLRTILNSVSDLVASAKDRSCTLIWRAAWSAKRSGNGSSGSALIPPHGDWVREAAEWFRAAQTDPVPLEVKLADL